MINKARTPDERYMICLYETAQELGDPETVLNKYDVGMKIGIHPKGVHAITQLLMRANFIKKEGEDKIYLTPHGISLAQRLLSE